MQTYRGPLIKTCRRAAFKPKVLRGIEKRHYCCEQADCPECSKLPVYGQNPAYGGWYSNWTGKRMATAKILVVEGQKWR